MPSGLISSNMAWAAPCFESLQLQSGRLQSLHKALLTVQLLTSKQCGLCLFPFFCDLPLPDPCHQVVSTFAVKEILEFTAMCPNKDRSEARAQFFAGSSERTHRITQWSLATRSISGGGAEMTVQSARGVRHRGGILPGARSGQDGEDFLELILLASTFLLTII